MKLIKRFFEDDSGIEFVEWALMCLGFALVVYGALGPLAPAITAFYAGVETALAG